jgi:hypothetical protein
MNDEVRMSNGGGDWFIRRNPPKSDHRIFKKVPTYGHSAAGIRPAPNGTMAGYAEEIHAKPWESKSVKLCQASSNRFFKKFMIHATVIRLNPTESDRRIFYQRDVGFNWRGKLMGKNVRLYSDMSAYVRLLGGNFLQGRGCAGGQICESRTIRPAPGGTAAVAKASTSAEAMADKPARPAEVLVAPTNAGTGRIFRISRFFHMVASFRFAHGF